MIPTGNCCQAVMYFGSEGSVRCSVRQKELKENEGIGAEKDAPFQHAARALIADYQAKNILQLPPCRWKIIVLNNTPHAGGKVYRPFVKSAGVVLGRFLPADLQLRLEIFFKNKMAWSGYTNLPVARNMQLQAVPADESFCLSRLCLPGVRHITWGQGTTSRIFSALLVFVHQYFFCRVDTFP